MFRLVLVMFMLVANSAGLNQDSQNSCSMADWADQLFSMQRSRSDDVTMSDTSRSYATVNLAFALACWLGQSTKGVGHIAYTIAKFGRYGCWCGLGGSGRTIDKIDKCCKAHDNCVDRATHRYKKQNWSVSIGFSIMNTVTCRNQRSYCEGSGLGRAACQCDRTAGYCLNKYRSDWKWWRVLFARMDC